MIRRSDSNFLNMFQQQSNITVGVVCEISSNVFRNYIYVGAKPK